MPLKDLEARREYQRNFRLARPRYTYEALKKHRRKLRKEAVAFLGGKCVHCGFTDDRALQIDHINGGGHKESKAIGQVAIYRKVRNGAEGYQLLCANCNIIKKVELNEVYCGPNVKAEE